MTKLRTRSNPTVDRWLHHAGTQGYGAHFGRAAASPTGGKKAFIPGL
jgi:hypothetical protein